MTSLRQWARGSSAVEKASFRRWSKICSRREVLLRQSERAKPSISSARFSQSRGSFGRSAAWARSRPAWSSAQA